jgi:hypothetical protein
VRGVRWGVLLCLKFSVSFCEKAVRDDYECQSWEEADEFRVLDWHTADHTNSRIWSVKVYVLAFCSHPPGLFWL